MQIFIDDIPKTEKAEPKGPSREVIVATAVFLSFLLGLAAGLALGGAIAYEIASRHF